AGNPHVRFDEGEVAPAATPRRGSLLYTNHSKTLRSAACALVGAVAIGSWASTFPSSSGDLASASDWGGTLPGTDERVVISNGTFTASQDVTFGGLERVYNTRNATNMMVFDQTSYENVKVSFAGFRPKVNTMSPANINWFKGGFFDFQCGAIKFDKNFDDAWANAINQRFVVTDGAVVTNISDMTLYGTSSTGSGIHVDDASLFVEGSVTLSGYGPASDSELLVSGGGLFQCDGRLLMADGVSASSRKNTPYFTTNHLVVTGSGSRFIGNGSPGVTICANDEYILVTDGGYFSGSVYFGSGNLYTTNCLMRVEKGARADIKEARLCAYTVNGLGGGRLEICDGALVSNNTTYVGTYVGSGNGPGTAGCTLLISNGTYVAHAVFIGQGTAASNNTMIVSGENALFDHQAKNAVGWTLFGGGPDCLIQVENNATMEWRYQGGWSYNSSISNCTVRITSGGTLKRSGSFHPGSDRNYNSASNRIEVLDGGTLDLSGKLSLSGDSCSLLVSNATVNVGKLGLGVEIPTGSITTNSLLVVAGETSKVSVTNGDFEVLCGSTVRFELPDSGYASASYAPVAVSGAATWDDGCALEISNADESLAAAKGGGVDSFTLLEAESISIPDETLAAAQAALGESCRLALRASGGRAALVLRRSTGTVIMVR
ncbi:MAG: hypothetical protein IJG84_00405, partial [Kiritimatiellae bacterium]|nr:hypothetical protein [Kiritimatiellia bacterium]